MSKSQSSYEGHWRTLTRWALDKTKARVKAAGQALVEYALILAVLVFALIMILSITGPAVGNVFSNVVANLLDLTVTPDQPMSEADFWNLVTAVASYTPDVNAVITNTPAGVGDADGDGKPNDSDNCPDHYNPGQEDSGGTVGVGDACDLSNPVADSDNDGVPNSSDNCPSNWNPDQKNSDAPADTLGDVCDPSPFPPPATNTPGPSPTPKDVLFPYPFDDNDNPDNWETDFDSILKGPWNAEWWDAAGSSAGDCNNGAIFNGTGGYSGSNPPKETTQESDIRFPRSSHSTWKTVSNAPHPNVSADFCGRLSKKFTLKAGNYTWKYKNDNSLKIHVNGASPMVNATSVNSSYVTTAWTVPADGEYDIAIVFVDTTGNAVLEVALLDGGLQDAGECDWQQIPNANQPTDDLPSLPSHSGSAFWSDSPTRNYYNDTYCILRLRGVLNLVSATRPRVEWWDKYDLAVTTDTAWFAIREQGTSDWMMQEIHRGGVSNYTWTRQEIRLDLFDGINGTSSAPVSDLDFRGKKVEVAFIMQADSATNDKGWSVDSFRVFEKTYQYFYMGYDDDAESTTTDWVTEGTWGKDTARANSGSSSWHDSPGANYASNVNSSLTLNGLLDLRGPEVLDPEIYFWHSYNLAATTDRIFVEASENEGETWVALKTSPSDATDYLEQATSIPATDFTAVSIPLDITGQNFIGKTIMIRFRIQTDASTNAGGWWIDDIQFRNKPVLAVIVPDYCETFEGSSASSDWTPEGSWGLSTTAYAGTKSMADSPAGSYSNNANSSLVLNRPVQLDGIATPLLRFWHRWEMGAGDNLYVEINEAEGPTAGTWQTIWQLNYGAAPAGHDTAFGSKISGASWQIQRAWQPVTVYLNPFMNAANTTKTFNIRFRLQANNSTNSDGWYLDDICFENMTDPVLTLPIDDDLEFTPSQRWLIGGQWAAQTSDVRGGANAMQAQYIQYTDSILQMRGIVNLSSVTAIDKPTLYYWENYRLNTGAEIFAEVREVNADGSSSTAWKVVATNAASGVQNWAYNRRQIDLSAYAGKYIRVRFRMQYQINTSPSLTGWRIDEVSIVNRASVETSIPLPYNEDAGFGAFGVVREGSWSILSDARPLGSGSALGPGLWTAEYFTSPSASSPGSFGTPLGTESISEIDFSWGSSSAPQLVLTNNTNADKDDRWMARYTRTVFFNEATTLQININSNDGHRMYIDTALVPGTNKWSDGSQSSSPSFAFSAGTHTLQVDFYENSGSASVSVNFVLLAGGEGADLFDGNSWSAFYYPYCNGNFITPPFNATADSVAGLNMIFPADTPQVVLDNNNGHGVLSAGGSGQPIQEVGGYAVFEAEVVTDTSDTVSRVAGAGPTYGTQLWNVHTATSGYTGTSGMRAEGGTGTYNNGTNVSTTLPNIVPRIDYRVNFTTTGTYTIYIRGAGPTNSEDSVNLGLNNTPLATRLLDDFAPTFGWIGGNTFTISTPGIYTINVWARQVNTVIDRIWIGTNTSARPGGGSCTTIPATANEYWLGRYERSITVADSTNLIFNLDSDDGHRLYVDGALIASANKWAAGLQTSTASVNLTPGTHTVRVEYRSETGSSRKLQLTYQLDGPVFHSDGSKTADYTDWYGASIIIEDEIDLSGTFNPTLTWWDKFELGNTDSVIVEVSVVGGNDPAAGAPSNWTTIYSAYSFTNLNWRKRLADLTPFAGQRIVIRFRVDSLNAGTPADGWYIDDIQVAE